MTRSYYNLHDLITLIKRDELEVVNQYLSDRSTKIDINAQDQNGKTLLHYASHKSNISTLKNTTRLSKH